MRPSALFIKRRRLRVAFVVSVPRRSPASIRLLIMITRLRGGGAALRCCSRCLTAAICRSG